MSVPFGSTGRDQHHGDGERRACRAGRPRARTRRPSARPGRPRGSRCSGMSNGRPLTGASSAASVAFQPRCAPNAVHMPPGRVEREPREDARQRDVAEPERGDVGIRGCGPARRATDEQHDRRARARCPRGDSTSGSPRNITSSASAAGARISDGLARPARASPPATRRRGSSRRPPERRPASSPRRRAATPSASPAAEARAAGPSRARQRSVAGVEPRAPARRRPRSRARRPTSRPTPCDQGEQRRRMRRPAPRRRAAGQATREREQQERD